MTCICDHVKGEHLLTGQCYQCGCTKYVLDIRSEKELIQIELQAQVARSAYQ